MTGDRGYDLLYPSFLAAYPVVFVAGANPGEFLWPEFAAVVLLALLVGAAVHATTAMLMPRAPRATVALTAAAANAFLFCSLRVADQIDFLSPRYTLPVMLLLCIAVMSSARRSDARASIVSRGTAIFTAALVLGAAASLAAAHVRNDRDYAYSATVRAVRAGLALPVAPLARRPDVFVVILDNLANTDVMRAVYGAERRPFQDSLRALGFTVPAVTRSNYCYTAQSVATLLNAQQVRGLGEDLGPNAQEREILYRLTADDAVGRWFRAAGYELFTQPSVGFPETVSGANATGTFGPGGISRLRLVVARGNLLPFVLHLWIPGRIAERAMGEPPRAKARLIALSSLPSAAALPSPKFVIAHSLAAHPPYVYDSTCAVVSAPRTVNEEPAAYRAAVACTERLVLSDVHAILRAARVPPIIILQADHGTHYLQPPQHDSGALITAAQAHECTGAFGAYLIPGGALPDTVSVANVMRYVIRSLGSSVAPVSDAAYYNTGQWPYRFVDVTPLVSAPRELGRSRENSSP